jgi:prepilin-type processing-associated H-X9-DG protein
VVLAFPRPRLALVGSTKYLGSALREAVSAPAGTGGGPWARLSEEPGEIVFAGRMPGALRQALEQELASWRSRRLKRGMDAERFLEFAQVYSLALMARDADAASGSLDAARQPDALRVAVEFASDRLVRAAAGLAEALAEPLAAALPVLFGAPPRAAPVREPMYRVQAEGKTVRVSMSRQALEDLAAEVTRGSRRQVTGVQSAGHLRQLGMAVQRYVADRKSYPKAWSELFAAGYLREPDVLVNPELKVHFADSDYHLVPLARDPGEKAFQTVLGYERWEGAAPPGGRLNVLFADGHVENLDFDRFQHLLDLTYRAIGR